MHRRAACFVCCMMSLLFVHTCYLLRAIQPPDFRASEAGCPYPIHSTNTCLLQGLRIQIAKRRDTYRHRPISVVPPQETKWTRMPFSGYESRCCSFCNKWEKMLRMRVRNGADRSRLPLVRPSRPVLRAPPGTRPRWAARGRVSRPGRAGRSSRRLTTGAVTVRCIRHRSRRRTTIAGVAPSAGRTSLPHRLLVVLQHLGHCCLHGSAGFLALLAQLTTQGQGGRPR